MPHSLFYQKENVTSSKKKRGYFTSLFIVLKIYTISADN